MFFRQKKSGARTYLQIVENRWESGGSRQRVVCTLGQLDELKASGQLDRLIASGAKFSESMMVIEAHSNGEAPVIAVRRIGRRGRSARPRGDGRRLSPRLRSGRPVSETDP